MVLLFGRFFEYSCFVTKIFCSVFVRTEHGIPKFGNTPNTEDFSSYEEHGMTPQERYSFLQDPVKGLLFPTFFSIVSSIMTSYSQ